MPLIGPALIDISGTMDYKHHSSLPAPFYGSHSPSLHAANVTVAIKADEPPAVTHRRKERHIAFNIIPEGGLHVHRWGWSTMASEEDTFNATRSPGTGRVLP